MSVMSPSRPGLEEASELVDAGSYARISKARRDPKDPEGIETTAGVRRQHEQNLALAAQSGLRVVREYTDNDISASGKKRRPEFEQLLQDLDAGLIRALVVWHGDRLLRVRGDLTRLIEVCTRRKVRILTVKAGEIDFTTASGRLMNDIMCAVAGFELAHSAERLIAKHAQLASEGKPNGGPRPFGYEKDRITVRPEEAALFKEAAQRFLANESLHSIARDWTQRGVRSTGHARRQPGVPTIWVHRTIAQMLGRARYAGLREVYPLAEDGTVSVIGTIVGEAQWEGIIDRDTCLALREKLADPKRRSRAGTSSSPQLLTGLLYCGQCGERMWSAGKGRMRCYGDPRPGCGQVYINLAGPEEDVSAAVLKRLRDGSLLADILRQGDDADLHQALARVQAKLVTLAEQWAADKLTDAAWATANDRLDAQRRDLTNRIEQARRSRGLADLPSPLEPVWDDLGVRRQAIRLIVAKIEVMPAGSEQRLKVHWKH